MAEMNVAIPLWLGWYCESANNEDFGSIADWQLELLEYFYQVDNQGREFMFSTWTGLTPGLSMVMLVFWYSSDDSFNVV